MRNNKNVYNYELLSALGVVLVCHASNVFLDLKVP